MRCKTTVTIKATTAKPTAPQNIGQFCPGMTKAMAPRMKATSPMIDPVHAATVRPWCTFLPRRFFGCTTSECCADCWLVPAMAGSLVSADRDLHSEHVPSRTALRLALPEPSLHLTRIGDRRAPD